MADNVLFEVDASQIIAKLHLAGVQAVSLEKDEFIVNTGILNDDANAKPDKPGKVMFDLKNSSGEYQAGFATWLEYHKTYELENLMNDLSQLLAKVVGDKSKLQDKDKKEQQKQISTLESRIKTILSPYGINAEDEQLKDPEKLAELKKEALDTIGNDDKALYDKAVEEVSKYAAQKLNTYMVMFAGKDNVKNIGPLDMGMIDISDKVKGPNDKSLVSMFEVQPMSEQEKAKMVEQFKLNYKEDPSKKNLNCKQKVCFVVKYTLNVDK